MSTLRALDNTTSQNDNQRAAVLAGVAHVDPDSDAWQQELSAITMTLIDALLEADAETLQSASDPLRDALASRYQADGTGRELRGWLLALLSMTRWGLQRLPAAAELGIAPDTQAWQFLTELQASVSLSSGQLRARLGTDDSQISRVGRQLLAQDLVTQRRIGRQATWELTPRGHALLRASASVSPPYERLAAQDSRRVHERAATSTAHRGTARDRATAPAGRRPRGPSAAGGGDDARYVLPDPHGGWRITKAPGGRAVERIATKADALARAREILSRGGGGTVRVYDGTGAFTKVITVKSS